MWQLIKYSLLVVM